MRAKLAVLKMLAKTLPGAQQLLIGALSAMFESMMLEIETLKARNDAADDRRQKFTVMFEKYLAAAVDGGAVPADVAREFTERVNAIDRGQ
jgi:hypothetical protein